MTHRTSDLVHRYIKGISSRLCNAPARTVDWNSDVLPDLQAEVDRLGEAVSRATDTAVSHVQTEVGRISSPDDGVLATAVAREVEKLRS